ncbi:MAG: hypothetical protein ACR2OJ_16140 [Hyphomicrobiales bacterium]
MTTQTHNLKAESKPLSAGARPEFPTVYVSDFLVTLLGASLQRTLVRNITYEAIGRFPDEIVDLANYYGGKCMGYPAVWLIKHALGIDDKFLVELAHTCKTSISLSLTTSIVDDWLDKDVDVSVAPVSLMYMLMVGGFGNQNSDYFPCELAQQRLKEITEHLLLVEKSITLKYHQKLELSAKLAKFSGMKIGYFHELIAKEFCNCMSLDRDQAQALCEIAKKFGCWCAFLDDIIDVRSDFELGDWVSLPALNLARRLHHEFGENVSPISHAVQLKSLSIECRNQMISQVRIQLKELGLEAADMGFQNLGRELVAAEEKLPVQLDGFLANA